MRTARVKGHDVIEEPMEVKKVLGYLPETAPNGNWQSVRLSLDCGLSRAWIRLGAGGLLCVRSLRG